MKKFVKVHLELPGDAKFVQTQEEFSGRVISTIVEVELTLGEINKCLSELESALSEMVWDDEDDG